MKINNKLCGMMNLGNTCFLNSCVQILCHTEPLSLFLNNLQKCNNVEDSIILKEFNDLRNIMNDDQIISPNKFIHYVKIVAHKKGRNIFTGHDQNDMCEFLNFLLDCMHNGIKRPIPVKITGIPKHNMDKIALICYNHIKTIYEKEYSEIMELFFGLYVSQIKSKTDEVYANKPEQYCTLDLPINNNTNNLYDCFDLFTQNEEISGYYNEKSKKHEDVYKCIKFWNFPKILIISLKRFDNDINKSNKAVVCPELLDLSKYIEGYYVSTYKYELYAVCNHIGNVYGGHYTCCIKKGSQWFMINDEKVNTINEVISPMTYCLFYHKKNN